MVDLEIRNEEKRLEALRKFDALETFGDGAFDDIVNMAATLIGVPIALISLVDKHRIFFKSKVGLEIEDIEREEGLCAAAIVSKDFYLVEEASKDPRTLANKLVSGGLGLEFYAAVPLTTQDGYNVGTLCVIDRKPRKLNSDQKEILCSLAKVVMNQMELRLQAREAVKSRSDLAYLLTHNLKGFMNNIPAMIEVLRNTKDDPEEFEKMLHLLENSAQKNSREINEFLDQADEKSLKTSYHFEKVDFSKVVQHIVKTSQIIAVDKNQHIDLHIEDKLFIVQADESKLMDTVDNLINNAIKYSPYGSTIVISVYGKGDSVVLKVQDQGPGLSDADKDGLFKAFSRLSAQPTGGEVSSGIGLWIAKEIVTAHNGRIWAESDGVGKGSMFFLELKRDE